MLVLQRYAGQAIVISDVGRVYVDSVKDKHGRPIPNARVKLAFEMPQSFVVLREELLDRPKQQEAT